MSVEYTLKKRRFLSNLKTDSSRVSERRIYFDLAAC